MDITFVGTNSNFIGDGFFDSNDSLDNTEATSVTPTQVILENSDTGVITTLSGTGFAEDSGGSFVAGTITGASFVQNGTLQGTIADISWLFTDLVAALLNISTNENFQTMGTLFSSSGPINVDASGAQAGYDFEDFFEPLTQFVAQPITFVGSPFEDSFQGGFGNDSVSMGGASGGSDFGENLYDATPGNDTINFAGADSTTFNFVEYDDWRIDITFDIDGQTGTGTATSSQFVDSFQNVDEALNADGLGLTGGTANDIFNLITTDDGYFDINGLEGNDTYNLTLHSGGRLNFNWGEFQNPTQGMIVNLATGAVSNDGHGGTDQINILGGNGRLEIRGTDNNDFIQGSDRDESFITEQGDDTVNGGGGTDRVRYDRSGVDAVFVDLGNDEATGTWDGQAFADTLVDVEYIRGSRNGDDTILGDGDDETFQGRGGNDSLAGHGGDDWLEGEGGDDTMEGGQGFDQAFFNDDFANAVFTDLGADLLQVVTADGTDLVSGVETLQFFDQGVNAADFYTAVSLNGTPLADTLEGSGAHDTISGGFGSDSLTGHGGEDNIVGGSGFDTMSGGSGNDTLTGGDGFDSLHGGDNDDLITGNNGLDTVEGGAGDDAISGGLGSDSLSGGDGDDVLSGQSGFDTVEGGSGNDTLNGNSGADTLRGGNGNDVLNGGIANDILQGGNEDDLLNGGNGADTLSGDDGDDRLEGNSGADYLHGGAGNDVLRGGLGADLFDFEVGDGHDRIVDLGNVDTVELDAALLTEATPVPEDLRGYASFNGDGFLVLTFATGDTLTFTGIVNTTAILDNVEFV